MKRSRPVGGVLVLCAVLLVGAVPVSADPNNNNSAKLRRAVTVEGILEHEAALQAIADAAAGNRLSGAPGYDDSADYVAARAAAAGFNVEVQEFEYTLDFLADYEAPVLSIEGGTEFIGGIAGASLGGDFGSMFKSTPYSVDITAPVWAIDLALPAVGPPNTSTSGCEAADYAGVPAGAIIIVQRGTCGFAQKFLLADASPAGAMVFINEGQPGRTEPLWFNFDGLEIPTFAATVETATELANGVLSGDTGTVARFKIEWRPGTYTTTNVIAETTSGDPNNVIVVGAHLDSVGVGPGINDNGSGSATILEIAEQMSKVKPRNQVRFIWFGAEESGLLGSEAYVASLSPQEQRTDRRDVELRHGRIAELRAVRLRRRPLRLASAARRRPRRVRPDRAALPRLLRQPRFESPSPPRSTADRTMGRSSKPGSPPADCSPAPKGSRRRSKPHLRWGSGRAVRPLLPPLVRRHRQPEHGPHSIR